MIVDVLKQAKLYEGVHPTFAAAVAGAQKLIADNVADGRYELTDGAYAMMQSYETSVVETPTYEAHRAYIDVQIMVKGNEVCYVTEREAATVTDAYHADGDYELLAAKGTAGVHTVELTDGVFAVFFPEDAHAPGLAANGTASPVRKVVVKLPVQK